VNDHNHDHQHAPNRFAVIPTPVRLSANTEYTGKGVTIAFLDSGFYPHPDLVTPLNRVVAYEDLVEQRRNSFSTGAIDSWQWHGTQTSVAAAGSEQLSNGVYRGLAHEAELVLVKVSERGRITEKNIAKGIQWPGLFEYKFFVDGQRWIEDPSNGMKAPDDYGSLNSVLMIN
jgi:serine protease AprX